ncbi:MAG TPA: peptidase M61, partial [Bacteroidia bacterium]|nr:peptidase M61 [Bacteroidia bacterium]
MKKIFFVLIAFVFSGTVFAQSTTKQPQTTSLNQAVLREPLAFANSYQPGSFYQFSIDLTKVHDDLLTVNLITPTMNSDTVIYRLPAIVPGTYKVYNFGKFTHGFKAMDKSGKELYVKHLDVNSWKIGDAKNLYSISYDVEDTWDTDVKGEFVFEPAGTNFQADTNFVLNNHCLYGYFDGMTHVLYNVSVTHPAGFFGATGLSDVTRIGNTDTYHVPDYMQLVDGPIMYDRPDTAHIFVGGADVLISVYSPHKMVSSKFVADSLRKLLDIQRQYLGGTLPVKNYAFIIYLNGTKEGFKSQSYGALEHSYSSMYTLPEMSQVQIAQTIINVSAHEFFHTLTPLSIHSFEIGDFDYNKPKMSQHLWMYEGLTEYAAHHVQVKYGTMSLEAFLKDMHDKMVSEEDYDEDLSFTKMSKGCLDEYEDQYNNVYQKGALIGMCLDIRLRQLSDGKYGTQDMMRDLSKKYGKDKSFVDDSLFSDIVKLTYPEIGDFFNRYVIGSEALPFEELFKAVGIEYKRRGQVEVLDPLGGYGLRLDGDGNLRLWPNAVNDFGKEMGYQKGDLLVSINGVKITMDNADVELGKLEANAKDGMKIVVKIKRLENGKFKPHKLK